MWKIICSLGSGFYDAWSAIDCRTHPTAGGETAGDGFIIYPELQTIVEEMFDLQEKNLEEDFKAA